MQDETKVHLEDHRRVHKQKMLHCSQCDFKAQFKSCLARHNTCHSGEKPFVCTHNGCAYSSSQAVHLVTHQLIHSNLKPFKCNLCGKCFKRGSHLNCHIRSHTGEKPYKCLFKDCDYSSTQKGTLQQHFRRHTGEKPFRCSYEACGYSSRAASHLKRHMKTHKEGNVYTCLFKNCHYSSIHASELKGHTNQVHILNKLHVCLLCEYRSETAGELKKHIVNNHQKALRTSINHPCLNSCNARSLVKIESTKTVSNSKLIKSLEVDEDRKISVRPFVRPIRLKSNNCSYKKDIPATSTKIVEASHDPIQKTKSRPYNSASPVDDPKLRIPTVVVLERLQVNYDSDDDFIPDILGGQADLNVPTASDYTEINTEPQQPQTGPQPKPQRAYLYSCKICHYETKKVKQYKSHLQSHREQRQFFCPLCDFVCCKIKLVKSHFRTHGNDSSASDSDRCNDAQSHHARVSIASKEAPFNNTSVFSVNTNCFGSRSLKNEQN